MKQWQFVLYTIDNPIEVWKGEEGKKKGRSKYMFSEDGVPLWCIDDKASAATWNCFCLVNSSPN